MQAAGAGDVTLTGSAGANRIDVNAGGTLRASGDLGDGVDTLDVAGTLITTANVNLGAGDDVFIVHDGTSVSGTVVGGAGLDTRVYDITGTPSVGALQEFEGLTKRNTGTLNITGPAATTDLQVVAVEGGTLNIGSAASVLAVNATSVLSGATLQVDGLYTGTTGDDTFTVGGIVTGIGSIALDAGDDTLVLNDGADLSGLANSLDGGSHVDGDTVVLNFSGDHGLRRRRRDELREPHETEQRHGHAAWQSRLSRDVDSRRHARCRRAARNFDARARRRHDLERDTAWCKPPELCRQ